MKKKILVIAGPTAVGKTVLSISIAEKINAEIISADSRQVFRYMTVGTAKPSAEELNKVPHHFIDIIDPDQSYNAGQFGTDGRARITEILSRGREVIIVGGSGLYIRSLIDGLFREAAGDEDLRLKIRDDMEKLGMAHAYDRLKSVDPESASRIHPNDAKRIERALEVYELTGKPISEFHGSQKIHGEFEPVMIGLTCERTELYRRIETRVDAMIANGVIEETKALLEKGYSPGLVSMESLGYREIVQYLNRQMTYDKMVSSFKQGSRNYAKRQWTWFRRDERIRWFDVTDPEGSEKLAEEIRSALQ